MHDLSDNIPAAAEAMDLEERRAPRFTLLIRTAKLVVEDREYLCVVRDISMTGASIKSFHRVPEGKRTVLEFPTGDKYPADLVWQKDGQAGFQFHTPIDVEDLIMATGDYPKRDLRFRVELPLQITGASHPIEAQLANVSRQGGLIQCDSILAIGQLLKIKAQGLPEIEARVRWRKGQNYGLVLDTTFSLVNLATLIERLHSRKDRCQKQEPARQEPPPSPQTSSSPDGIS